MMMLKVLSSLSVLRKLINWLRRWPPTRAGMRSALRPAIRKVHQLKEVDMLTAKIDLLMKKLENPGLDHLKMVDARVMCEECEETGHMGINYPTVSQVVNFVGDSNNGFILIKASMLGGINPVSRSTTTNKVVWGKISTEMSPLSEISSGIR
jgi:hypothetical protein